MRSRHTPRPTGPSHAPQQAYAPQRELASQATPFTSTHIPYPHRTRILVYPFFSFSFSFLSFFRVRSPPSVCSSVPISPPSPLCTPRALHLKDGTQTTLPQAHKFCPAPSVPISPASYMPTLKRNHETIETPGTECPDIHSFSSRGRASIT